MSNNAKRAMADSRVVVAVPLCQRQIDLLARSKPLSMDERLLSWWTPGVAAILARVDHRAIPRQHRRG
jgi:hypothetical protein